MDSKDLAIGVLSTTAVILFVGVLLVQTDSKPALASGMGDSGGDYIMLSGSLWNQEELLYVIDTDLRRMLTYRFDVVSGQIMRTGGEALDKYFKAAVKPPAKKKSGRRRRRP